MDIPLIPNSMTDSDRGTVVVIASQWGNDDADRGPIWFVTLLMHYEAPFYEVVEYTLNDNGGHENECEATNMASIICNTSLSAERRKTWYRVTTGISSSSGNSAIIGASFNFRSKNHFHIRV